MAAPAATVGDAGSATPLAAAVPPSSASAATPPVVLPSLPLPAAVVTTLTTARAAGQLRAVDSVGRAVLELTGRRRTRVVFLGDGVGTAALAIATDASGAHQQPTLLLVIPLVPQRTAQLPDRAGSGRFVHAANVLIALATANAYISTLGGGHFLCKQVAAARAMAVAQMRVAVALRDDHLLARCHVHLVYCSLQEGDWAGAAARLAGLAPLPRRLHDDVLASMLVAAQGVLDSATALAAAGALDPAAAAPPGVVDELYRWRLPPPRSSSSA